MALLINILLGFYVFVALLMVLVILMQRPKSEGLGAAFGGGVTENIFGAQTTNVLTKITSWLATFFFLLTFGLSILYAHKSSTKSELRRELMKDLPAGGATSSATPSPGSSATASPSSSATVSPGPSATASPGRSGTPKATGTVRSTPPGTMGSPSPSVGVVPSSPPSSAMPTGSVGLSPAQSSPAKGTPKG